MTSPMGLTIPTPSITTGPLYATQVSGDLTIIESHRHTGESNDDGYQVPSAGLDINEDLSFQSNNVVALRSARFSNQGNVLVGIGDVGCVYENAGDLWYNNAAGVPIQITSGSAVIAPVGGYSIVEASNNITIDPEDTFILVSCDTTSNTIIVTLPLASTVAAGRFYIIKDTSGTSATNNITIVPNGSNTIDLSANDQVIKNNFGALCIVSDADNNWILLNYSTEITPKLSSSTTITIPNVTTDATYILDVTSASISVALPSLSNIIAGIKITIKDSGSASAIKTISIVPNGSNKIEGLNVTKTIFTAYGEVNLLATSAGWFMI